MIILNFIIMSLLYFILTHCSSFLCSPSFKMDISNEKYDLPKIFERSTYTWILPKFAQLKAKYGIGKSIESPDFPQVERKYKWKLRLYPNGFDLESFEFVSLFLLKSTATENVVFTKYTILLQNSNDVTLAERKGDIYSKNGWGYPNFLSHGKFISSIPDGSVKIRVVIFAEILTLQLYHTVDPPSISSVGLSLLYESGYLSDFTFKFNEGNEIPVHRAILAARSSVFSAMFAHNTSENKLRYTTIRDVEGNIMSILLDFIYTGNLKSSISVEETEKLLVAAERYKVTDLKLQCVEKLSEELVVSNVLDILLTAELNNVSQLKGAAFDYIRKNAGEFSNSTKFNKIKKYPDLLVELLTEMTKLAVNISET